MGSRRGFICRMKIGNMPVDPMTSSHTVRIRQRNTLGPSSDGQQYAVVHVTGYIKNWPPSGKFDSLFFVHNVTLIFHSPQPAFVLRVVIFQSVPIG